MQFFNDLSYSEWGVRNIFFPMDGGLAKHHHTSFCFIFNFLYMESSQTIRVKVLPAPMTHRAASIFVSKALGHTSVNAMKATAGGWPTGSFACLAFPLNSFISNTGGGGGEGSEYHF